MAVFKADAAVVGAVVELVGRGAEGRVGATAGAAGRAGAASRAEIRLCPFSEPQNFGGALAPPAPPLSTQL